jgi:hypothetical protein
LAESPALFKDLFEDKKMWGKSSLDRIRTAVGPESEVPVEGPGREPGVNHRADPD